MMLCGSKYLLAGVDFKILAVYWLLWVLRTLSLSLASINCLNSYSCLQLVTKVSEKLKDIRGNNFNSLNAQFQGSCWQCKHLKRHSVPPFGHGFGSFGAPCWSLFGSIVKFWQIRAECCRREVRSQKFSVRTLPPDHPHRPSRPKASFMNKQARKLQATLVRNYELLAHSLTRWRG